MGELKKTEIFHRKKKDIPKIISNKTGSKEIIYGARALNKQFPTHLQEHTTDYDIFSPTPKKDAKETEQALDKHFGGDFFDVEAAQHSGTWKVKGMNGKTYADYTEKPKGVRSITIDNKKYLSLNSIGAHIKKTLKDDSSKFRWRKDQDAYNRIKLALQRKGRT